MPNNMQKSLPKRNIISKYLNKLYTIMNNREIIKKLSIIEEYDVLSMPAFRMTVDKMIKNNPKGSIIMTDINDLFIANKFRGKSKVNEMILNITNKIKHILDKNECGDYKIAKMGDEIYIYLPNKNDEETNKITTELQSIKEKELTISAGFSSDLSLGLTPAVNNADRQMSINKNKFKTQRLKDICGDDLYKITDYIITSQFNKMRISLQNLKETNSSDLRNTFEKALRGIKPDEIISHKNGISSYSNKDSFSELKNKYESEAKLIFGNNEKLINEYILATMLSKHSVHGVINSEYFQKIEYKESFKEINKEKTNKFDILVSTLSGIKTINDTLGHDEGDRAIDDSLTYLSQVSNENTVQTYSSIIAKGGGNSYVLIENMNNDRKNMLLNSLQKYGLDNSNNTLTIMSSIQTIDKDSLSKDDLLSIVNYTVSKTENTLDIDNLSRKLTDTVQIQNVIKKIYEQLINNPDVQVLFGANLEEKDKILKMINSRFKNLIQNEKEKSMPKNNYLDREPIAKNNHSYDIEI